MLRSARNKHLSRLRPLVLLTGYLKVGFSPRYPLIPSGSALDVSRIDFCCNDGEVIKHSKQRAVMSLLPLWFPSFSIYILPFWQFSLSTLQAHDVHIHHLFCPWFIYTIEGTRVEILWIHTTQPGPSILHSVLELHLLFGSVEACFRCRFNEQRRCLTASTTQTRGTRTKPTSTTPLSISSRTREGERPLLP